MESANHSQDEAVFVCPKTGKVFRRSQPKGRWLAWLLPAAGLLSLAWFLVRVIPKPSRALYPCQRMAFPIASGFVAWLVGMVTAVVAFRKAREFGRQKRALVAIACLAVAVGAGLHTLFNVPTQPVEAALYTVPQTPNTPVGVAKGLFPGRVVWVHDPRATDFLGAYTGDGYWWEARHNDQAALDKMMSAAIRRIGGAGTDQAAWDAIFRHFNQTRGRGNVGYTAGEKINIMPNLVAQANQNDNRVNLATYVQTGYAENVSVSPWMLLSLLRQLVYKAGVPQENISVGQSMCWFPKQYWDACHTEFPNVVYLCNVGQLGRTKFLPSTNKFYWSKPGVSPAKQDYIPLVNAQATYFINIANLKAHEGGGISQCGKNYYGGLIRRPSDSGYYELHGDLPFAATGHGRYRTMTDFIAHPDFGGKALLYMQDGLWGGLDAGTRPSRWTIWPFNNDWPSSLLVSQDPIAIDSVGLDACKAAMPTHFPVTVVAADDYLHEAALIDNPPSGVFYDPDRSGVRRASLGVHEHWNNNVDRKYSRNLGTGTGIELVWLSTTKTGDATYDGAVDIFDLLLLAGTWNTSTTDPNYDASADLNNDGVINIFDLLVLADHWNT